MASDVHVTMAQNASQERSGRTRGACSTSNLVQLLREAERGNGLGIDYADALSEALGQADSFGKAAPSGVLTQREKGGKRSLTLLGRFPSINKKRTRWSRVIPSHADPEERKPSGISPQQLHQEQHITTSDRRSQPQLGAAPSDGGQIGIVKISSIATAASGEPVVKQGETVIHCTKSECSHASNLAVQSHPTRGNGYGIGGHLQEQQKQQPQPQPHQQQQPRHQPQQQLEEQKRQHRRNNLLPRSFPVPTIGQNLDSRIANATDGGGDAMSAITDDDIRRAYVTLHKRPEDHRSVSESRNYFLSSSVTEHVHLSEVPLPSSGEGGGEGRFKGSAVIAKNLPYTQLQLLGSAPSMPGAPRMPVRKGFSGLPAVQSSPAKHRGSPDPTPLGTSSARTLALSAPAIEECLKKSDQTGPMARAQDIQGNTPPSSRMVVGTYGNDVAFDAVSAISLISVASTTSPVTSSAAEPELQGQVEQQRWSSRAVLPVGVNTNDGLDMIPVEPTTVKLAEGLGSWAEETVAVGRLVDEDNRRLAVKRAGETRKEEEMRRILERGMGTAVKTLPLGFLRDSGYLWESLERGLKNITRIMKRVAVDARHRAWDKWKYLLVDSRPPSQFAITTVDTNVGAAVARGFLARRRVAGMRKARNEAAAEKAAHTRFLLQHRMVKVLKASRTVASCLITNAATRRWERSRRARSAVAMVERCYISRRARRQGWGEIVAYRNEHSAAGVIQRWTRGTLVRRRIPLARGLRRIEKNDVRFAITEEVFVAHLVDHGAAVVIQEWWRTLGWRMKRLRMRYRHHIGVRATVIQRAYRRRLMRLVPAKGRKVIKIGGGKTAAAVFSSVLARKIGRYTIQKMENPTASGEKTIDPPGRTAAKTVDVGLAVYPATVPEQKPADASKREERTTRTYVATFPRAVAERIRRAGAGVSGSARKAMLSASSRIQMMRQRKKHAAAIKVAGAVMVVAASRMLLKKKEGKEIKAATKIQKLIRVRKHNKTVTRHQDLFRAVWTMAVHRSTSKGKAELVVQALGRRYIARRRFRLLRSLAIRLQPLVRGWLGRRMTESYRAYTQHLGEERELGRVRWEQLARRRLEEELVRGARVEDLEDDLELHRIFMKYCRFGDRRNTGRMVAAKLTALCKDAGLVEKRFPIQRVEICFSRLKPKDLSYLPYSSFLECLDDITGQHPNVRRLADNAAATAIEERVAPLPTPTACVSATTHFSTGRPWSGSENDCESRPPVQSRIVNRSEHSSEISVLTDGATRRASPRRRNGRPSTATVDRKKKVSESAKGGKIPVGEATVTTHSTGSRGRRAEAKLEGMNTVGTQDEVRDASPRPAFRAEDQRLLVLLQNYVLVNSQVGREVHREMSAEGRGARQRALSRLESAAVTLQASVARGCAGRVRARKACQRREIVRYDARFNWAATRLQTRFRIFSARTRVSKMAVKRFYRCLDDLTGAEYYFDPYTGKAWWTKPKILWKFDIPTAVVVPAGEEIMVPMCDECAQEVAVEICADCDEAMLCEPCVRRLHGAGKAANHLRVPIEKCDECSFQVAVKHCKQCGDNFCVSCFAYLHRKGRLRRHTFEPLVAMCHDCGERPQAFRCFGCHTDGHLLLCKPCLDARHLGLAESELACHRIEAVGLRSMAVKRRRQEKATRATELWKNAALAAAERARRQKQRVAAAIKIQSVWRGFLARKRRRHLMGQHLLWRMQRLRDDQIRRTMIYKMLLFWGKAPLLKSDTNRELVLTQYPRWWQSTIIDIVKPTFGWREGAKMVREQQFFKKKTKRKGRWRVPVARLRLAGARLRVHQAMHKQRKLENRQKKEVEAYQQARSQGGVTSEQREKLQQASRKAKRAVQKHEAERMQTERKVKAAQDSLEALIGPFRLRKNVRDAMRKGLLLPFPVSVQTGKAIAKLEPGQNMRQVLRWIPYDRRVRIEPREHSSEASVEASRPRRPPSHALGPFYVLGVKGSHQREGRAKGSSEVAGFSGISVLKEYRKNRQSPMETKGDKLKSAKDEAGSGEGSSAGALKATSGATCPLLVLDRQWLLEEAPQCQAYAMPILPFPQKILASLATGFRYNILVQGMIRVAVIGAHFNRDRLERWQTKFDDDSQMHARLGRWAKKSMDLSKSLMLRRRCLFDVEKGFEDEKLKVMEIVEFVLSLWTSLKEVTDFAKSAAATGLISQQGGNGTGIGGKLGREVVVQLFKKWVRSDNKTKVIIMHRSGKSANDPAIEVVQVVGYININLDTPTPILREFIRRFCGSWLNEHAKGERFAMESSTGEIVRRSREGEKFFATANDMVQERVDKATRNTEAVVFVQDEKRKKGDDSEVEPVLIPTKDFLDPDWTPKLGDETCSEDEGEGSDFGETRKKSKGDGDEGGDEEGEDSDISSATSSDGLSVTFGSIGSDIEEDDEDSSAAMEDDLHAQKEEEEDNEG